MKIVSSRRMQVKPFQNETSKARGGGMVDIKVERRSHERTPARIQARFFCGNRIYAGNITDVSEKGMFVRTDMSMPVDSKIDIMILVDRKVVKIPVTVRRRVNGNSSGGPALNSGMGVELTRSVRQYTEYIQNLKSFGPEEA